MQHPEIDQRNPFGYSVHWQAIGDSRQGGTVPWLKIIFVCAGSALLSFSGGYYLANRSAESKIAAADRQRQQAESLQNSAASDLAAVQQKNKEQSQRLRLVNDCVYAAINDPLPTPPPPPVRPMQ